jgi:hypothetical protein
MAYIDSGNRRWLGINYWQGKYAAVISFNHTKINCGKFDTIEEAARARDRKALELYGDAAELNFPEEYKR